MQSSKSAEEKASGGSKVRERGRAPKRGGHSTVFVSTKCICAVADNPHQKLDPRSRIPRRTSHFSQKMGVLLKGGVDIWVSSSRDGKTLSSVRSALPEFCAACGENHMQYIYYYYYYHYYHYYYIL